MIDLSNGFTVKERIVLICGKVAVDLLSDEHSHDGGKTWGNTIEIDAGKAGEYKTRVRKQRLGRSRDRVYEVSVSDAIPWRITDAYLDLELGTS